MTPRLQGGSNNVSAPLREFSNNLVPRNFPPKNHKGAVSIQNVGTDSVNKKGLIPITTLK